jgi:LysR family hydrogen peroxide-inducible transcriptional activator
MIDFFYHSRMKLQELTYLVAVADHRHFGRAADACHVTQPTLSAGLRNLERKLDLVLCERGPRGVVITRVGQPVVDQARRVLAEAQRLEHVARRDRSPLTGIFRLGAIPTIGPYLMPHILAGIRARWPDLRLHLVEARTDPLLADLRRGVLDLAILSPPVADKGLQYDRLYREEFFLALPAGHPLGRKRRPRLADLAGEPLLLLDEGHCLRDQVVEFCRIGDAAARDLIRSSSLETLRNMVDAGMGCTLLPALAVKPEAAGEIRSLARPAPFREVGLYRRNDYPDVESAELLAATIRDCLPAALLRP